MTKREKTPRLAKIADRLWDESARIQVDRARSDSTVLSVRMPRGTLRALTEFAREEGKGPGTLARELIEQGLALESSAPSFMVARVLGRLLEVQRMSGQHRANLGGALVSNLPSSCSPTGYALRRLNEFRLPYASSFRAMARYGLSEGRERDFPWVFSFAGSPGRDQWAGVSLATLTSPTGEQVAHER